MIYYCTFQVRNINTRHAHIKMAKVADFSTPLPFVTNMNAGPSITLIKLAAILKCAMLIFSSIMLNSVV